MLEGSVFVSGEEYHRSSRIFRTVLRDMPQLSRVFIDHSGRKRLNRCIVRLFGDLGDIIQTPDSKPEEGMWQFHSERRSSFIYWNDRSSEGSSFHVPIFSVLALLVRSLTRLKWADGQKITMPQALRYFVADGDDDGSLSRLIPDSENITAREEVLFQLARHQVIQIDAGPPRRQHWLPVPELQPEVLITKRRKWWQHDEDDESGEDDGGEQDDGSGENGGATPG